VNGGAEKGKDLELPEKDCNGFMLAIGLTLATRIGDDPNNN
jgi:hypothetical protein